MQVHCDEGIANHIGPEPCVVGREAGGEASAGVRIGQPLSRERMSIRDADADVTAEGETGSARQLRTRVSGPAVVRDPGMCVSSSTGNRETSTLAHLRSKYRLAHREGDEHEAAMMHGVLRGASTASSISSYEADERGRATGPGVRGAKWAAKENAERTVRPGHRAGKARPTDWAACGKSYASPPTSKVGAGCLKSGPSGSCGGRSAMSVRDASCFNSMPEIGGPAGVARLAAGPHEARRRSSGATLVILHIARQVAPISGGHLVLAVPPQSRRARLR